MGSKLSLYAGVSAAALALSGCVDGGGLGSSRPETAATAAADRPAATRLVETDVEAPDVFQKSEAALWDGRPSLGGVWVAHPEAVDPERVMIRNRANGETVIGALFRRERDMPGPRFQVSSDAAASLGMLAGAPVEIDVTALRRQEAPAGPAEPETTVAEADAPEAGAAAPVETASADPVAGAAAAIDRAEAEGTAATATTEATAPAKKGGLFGGLFRRKPEEPLSANAVASVEGAAETSAATAETVAESSAPPPAIAQAAAEPAPTRGGPFGLFRRKPKEPLSAIGVTDVQTTAAGALVAPEITSEALAPQPASARAPAASSLSSPFVQIGIFSMEDNAERTAADMRKSGLSATVYEQQSAGKTFWRVLVGPAADRSEQSAILRKVKGLGFADAYAVAR